LRLALAKIKAAEHGHAADSALRPQDRGDFESWFLLQCILNLSVRRG
jgi:hypothetical protein